MTRFLSSCACSFAAIVTLNCNSSSSLTPPPRRHRRFAPPQLRPQLESQLTEALSSNDDLQESTKKLKTSLQSLESKSSDDHATLTSQITSLTTKLQNSEQLSDESQTELRNSTESSRKLQINLDDALEQVAFHVTELEDLRGVMADKEREKEEEVKELEQDLENLKRRFEEGENGGGTLRRNWRGSKGNWRKRRVWRRRRW